MSQDTVDEIVEQAKKPGVFNIINVLKERAYPKDSVRVSLDEAKAFEAARVDDEIDELKKEIGLESDADKLTELEDKLESLNGKREKLVEEIYNASYVFNIVGISEGRREEIFKDALEKYPLEYETKGNALLGNESREEKPNAERDRWFTNMLWTEHIESIVDPEGNVQGRLDFDSVVELRANLPISAITKINEAVEKVRMATAVFMLGVDEDFLAKS